MDSPHFRDIYLNLMHGKVPLNKEEMTMRQSCVNQHQRHIS